MELRGGPRQVSMLAGVPRVTGYRVEWAARAAISTTWRRSRSLRSAVTRNRASRPARMWPEYEAARPAGFAGAVVPAAQVHAAFMAALQFGYAKLVSTEEYLA